MKILVEYPSREELSRIVDRSIQRDEPELRQVITRDEILELRAVRHKVVVAPHIREFAVSLVLATQPGTSDAHPLANKYIRYGASPRGAQALVECGRVHALMAGRYHLAAEDIRKVAPAVLRHRIILNFDAHADGQNAETVVREVIDSVGATMAKV